MASLISGFSSINLGPSQLQNLTHSLDEFYSSTQTSPSQELKDLLKQLCSYTFQQVVIGNSHAGKSSYINSVIGTDIINGQLQLKKNLESFRWRVNCYTPTS